MAPPVNRRTGYSRRAQYSTFLAYVVGVIGALAGAFLLFGSAGSQALFAPLRALAADVTVPLGRGVTVARNGLGNGWDIAASYATWGSENARLRREVQVARVKAVEANALANENLRLKAALKLASDTPHPVASGWLVASTASSTRRYAIISAGALQGVRSGMPVRSVMGLVGRVLEVGQTSARVLLLTDSESIVPVRRASDGVAAFATGRADGTVQLRLLTLSINPLKVGDAFVTSGSGGLYWPGTPIAVVTQLTHDGAIARVLSDPAASELVVVQPSWNPVEDPTLPPPADPAASALKARQEKAKADRLKAKADKAKGVKGAAKAPAGKPAHP